MKDLIDKGIVNLEHSLSEEMIADFFTKPLQGKKFQIFRDIILNNRQNKADPAIQYRSVLGNKQMRNIVSAE